MAMVSYASSLRSSETIVVNFNDILKKVSVQNVCEYVK